MSWSAVFFDLATHAGHALIDHQASRGKRAAQPQAQPPAWPTLPQLPQMPAVTLPQVAMPTLPTLAAPGAPTAVHRSLPADVVAPSYAEEFGVTDDTSPAACWSCTRRHVNTGLKAAEAGCSCDADGRREAAMTVLGEVAVWEQYDITEDKIRNTSPERRAAVLAAIPGMKRAAGCLMPPPADLHLAWASAVEAYRFANSSGGNPSPMERREADLRMEDVQGWVGLLDTKPLGREAAPHLDAIRHARHRLNRDGNAPEAVAQMRDALRSAAVALTPDPGEDALRQAKGHLLSARDAFYQGALGAMKQTKAQPELVRPVTRQRAYYDIDTRIPEALARSYLVETGTASGDILGATPQTREAFANLEAFDRARYVPVRVEPIPPIIEGGEVQGVVLGAYFPETDNIWVGPQAIAEAPKDLYTLAEETAHSLLDNDHGCNVWRSQDVAYADMPEERESKLAAMLALWQAGMPMETDTGRRIAPQAVRLDIVAMEQGEDPRILARALWAADLMTAAMKGDVQGAAAKSGACPR